MLMGNTPFWKRKNLLILSFLFFSQNLFAETGTWKSTFAGDITYISSPATNQKKDQQGKLFTIVYLENLGFRKLGRNTNAEDVQWLRDNGFAVIELDYGGNSAAVSPNINKDILAINTTLSSSGTFCGIKNISSKRTYILFEGYRIRTDVAYYQDDPTVYNYPDAYKVTKGDSLYMDIIYPANAEDKVPVILSFSYSNSWGHKTTQGENAHLRMYLPYTIGSGSFHDTILEGAPARGMAWAIADHPKYCEWGQGKRTGGANKEYGSIATNPDGARKVKSAVRTLRAVGKNLGLSSNIAIYGFSRGSTIGALAVGDRRVDDFETYGIHQDVPSDVQAAVLGPGVFDYTIFADGFTDKNEFRNGTKVWGDITIHRDVWNQQGALYLCETDKTAPCLFFYNSDDEKFYAKNADVMKKHLDGLGIATELIKDFGNGHRVPDSEANLNKIYNFFEEHLKNTTAINDITIKTGDTKSRKHKVCDLKARTYNDMPNRNGIYIVDGKKVIKR